MNINETKWYDIETFEVLKKLESDIHTGLTETIVAERLDKYGENKLPSKKKQSVFIRFLKHFNDILIYILFVAALISVLLGHYTDTAVIILVAVINAFIGFFQEDKAEKALENIKNMLSLKANVIRNGKRIELDATQLTIGDIVLLKPGDKVPADLRLLNANNLKIEESALTGESVASEKTVAALPADTMLGDRQNMAFSSTTVRTGTAKGIVVAVGKNTEIGKINEMIAEVETMTTPLLKQTYRFGRNISIVIVSLASLIYAFGYFFRDYSPSELLMAVIGLSVAAIPEGLPAILSIILAIGVQNMAKRKSIIRNLPSVETLGSVSVICSDKTGTLTKNEMTVKTLATSADNFKVSGVGYSPQGQITKGGDDINIDTDTLLKNLVNCFYYCNEATLEKDEKDQWQIKGDPTEGSLITLYHKSGLSSSKINKLATIPFDSEYKYMATLVANATGQRVIYIKGAPDRLLQMADKQAEEQKITKLNKEYWESKIGQLARKGQRVIGAAYKIVDDDKTAIDHSDIHEGIVFLGLAGIIDPPREEAIEAVRLCKGAGITVKMITGDHVDTAKAIGKEMGIGDGVNALEGRDLELMSDQELKKAVTEVHVFARTSPEHKLRIVKALQENDIICAMTGDGVNDAPALKKANIGIAMGIKGTEVTKDSSEMVLADDNFSSIAAAIEEGRRVYDNLKKTILFILPTNGAQSFLIAASILFGTIMPLAPVQILWVNMVIAITVSLALAFEKIEPDAMKRPPRSTKSQLINGYYVWRILFVSLLIGGGTLLINMSLLKQGVDKLTVRSITLQIIVFAQMFHVFNNRSIGNFALNKYFFSNPVIFWVSGILILVQVAINYIPFMNNVLGINAIHGYYWIYPLTMGVCVFIIVELEKMIMKRLGFIKLY